MGKPVRLNGTTLEGGGQLLRIALAFSALTGTPVHISDIRGGRSGGGGLKHQHLAAVNWLITATDADAEGAELKSKLLKFEPNSQHGSLYAKFKNAARNPDQDVPVYFIEQKTPGSISLIIQALLPFLLFSGASRHSNTGHDRCKLIITGGTNTTQSPSFEYLHQVLLPMLKLIGLPPIELKLGGRGWSHNGTSIGQVQMEFQSLPQATSLPAFRLEERGEISKLHATILAPADCKSEIIREVQAIARAKLSTVVNSSELDLSVTFEDSRRPKRFYLLLVASTENGLKLGRDLLYCKRIQKVSDAIVDLVTQVTDDLATEIEHGGCVDEFMRDQLVIFQALAKGRSVVNGGSEGADSMQPSLHTRTAQWVASELLKVDFDKGGACQGVGFEAG